MRAGRLRDTPCTRTEFLEWESRQDERWEFVVPFIRMMAGGTADHNRIAGNIFAALKSRLRGGPCEAFRHNMKLAPAANEDVTYPDVLVTCRKVDGTSTLVESATALVEVVSRRSQDDDYGRKWESYQEIADLRHYAIVHQEKPSATIFSRVAETDEWSARHVSGLDAMLELKALGIVFSLGEVYEGTRVAVG